LVEGSQQIALARYVASHITKIDDSLRKFCFTQNLDGAALRDAIIPLIDYWQFETKLETLSLAGIGEEYVYMMGNETGICSPANVTLYQQDMVNNLPLSFQMMIRILLNGMYMTLGVKIPTDKLEKQSAIEIAINSWFTVYAYYWSSFCLFMACSIAFMFLIRRHQSDVFDWVSISARGVALAIGAGMIAVISSDSAFWRLISSPGILPVVLGLFFLVMFFDRISAMFANWRLQKTGEKYAFEDRDGHSEGKHGDVHFHDPTHEPLVPDHHRKSAAWGLHSDREPLTAETAYQPPEYPLGPVTSPPAGYAPGGYAPVHHGHGQV
jgi:hypothetical protein